MILNKVGSDAGLVLSGELTLSGTTATLTIDQSFDYADIKNAAKTRFPTVDIRTTNATLIAIFGDNAVGFITNFFDSVESIVVSAAGSGWGIGALALTKDADTGVWSGSVTIS